MAERWPRLPLLPPPPEDRSEIDLDDDLALVEEPPLVLDWETRKTQRVSKADYDRMREQALAEIAGGIPSAQDDVPRDTLKTLPIETSETIHAVETIPPPVEIPDDLPPYIPPDPILVASPDPRRAPVERAARRLAWVLATCTLALAAAILIAALLLR